LNNNTPVHVIQALLGHASPDTVMIYAKLYPSQLIEEYRKTVRSLYNAYYGEDGLKNPTAEEWAAFATSCNLRDMGTHLCALPTGEHCPKGLICLRLRACSAQEERPAHLSANAGKPRAQPGCCARSQRTCPSAVTQNRPMRVT
jgi:hypothetical protein